MLPSPTSSIMRPETWPGFPSPMGPWLFHDNNTPWSGLIGTIKSVYCGESRFFWCWQEGYWAVSTAVVMIRMDKSHALDISLANQRNPKIKGEFVARGRARSEWGQSSLPAANSSQASARSCSLAPVAGENDSLQILPAHNQVRVPPWPSQYFLSQEVCFVFISERSGAEQGGAAESHQKTTIGVGMICTMTLGGGCGWGGSGNSRLSGGNRTSYLSRQHPQNHTRVESSV